MIAYLGTPGRLRHQTAEQALGEVAGPASAEVLPLVEAICDDVYSEPQRFFVGSPKAVGDAVAAYVEARFPRLFPAAVDAVANSFAFDYK